MDDIQHVIQLHDIFPEVKLNQFVQFIVLGRKLKDDILLAQPAKIPATEPPEFLPPSVERFLQDSCNMVDVCVLKPWELLRELIWNGGGLVNDNCMNQTRPNL